MLPKAGERFGPYEILARLGGGGMGVVFRAWDERLHREVAVKLLHEDFREPVMRRRFLLEARAASALAHPNICTIFDMGEQDGEPYLVMELLAGETLRDRIAQRACSVDEVVRYGKQIVDALGAAHAKGIVHRDIKPANIFIQNTPNGECIKILDFGLAKVSMALRSGRDSRVLELTSEGCTVGTLAYMSPEQARGEALDARSDLFSTGIVLYEMAARRTPFHAGTTALAFQSLLSRPPEPIRTWNLTVPREVERIITRLLSKGREQRYSDAAAVQQALEKLLARGNGDWLRRFPPAVVPVVPAPDPVVHRQRPKVNRPKPASVQTPDRETDPAQSAIHSPSSQGHLPAAAKAEILRPRKLPQTEQSPQRTQGLPHRTGPGPLLGSPQESLSRTEQPSQTRLTSPTQTPSLSDSAEAGTPSISGSVSQSGSSDRAPRSSQVGDASKPEQRSSAALDSSLRHEPRITDPFSRKSQRTSRESSGSLPIVRVNSTPGQSAAGTPKPDVGQRRKSAVGRRFWISAVSVLVLGLICLLVNELRSGGFSRVAFAPEDRILLVPVANQTGNSILDNGVSSGLELALSAHSRLLWMGTDAYRAGQRIVAKGSATQPDKTSPQAVARALHARAYLYGELKQESSHLTLRLDIFNTASNDRIGSITKVAENADGLPTAITDLAQTLQQQLGEADRQGSATPKKSAEHLPGITALSAYSDGETRWADGDAFGAAESYRRATASDPDFAAAHLRLAWLYAGQGADLAAADSASRAWSVTSGTSERIQQLAHITRLALVDGDLGGALQLARQTAAARPRDTDALSVLATVNRLSGHMTEALLAAQRALSTDPYSRSAADEVALAMIGQNRFEEARAVSTRARLRGVLCQCGQSFLDGTLPNPDPSAIPPTSMAQDVRYLWEQAVVAEQRGDGQKATELWHQTADLALSQASLSSAAAGALALQALNESLHGNCQEARGAIHHASLLASSRNAAYHLALAAALCGSLGEAEAQAALQRMEAGNSPGLRAKSLEMPLVQGADLLAKHQPAQAALVLTVLPITRDAPPFSLYLHGAALDAVQAQAAAASALTIAQQRTGYALLTGVPVASLAEHLLHAGQAKPGRPRRIDIGRGKVY